MGCSGSSEKGNTLAVQFRLMQLAQCGRVGIQAKKLGLVVCDHRCDDQTVAIVQGRFRVFWMREWMRWSPSWALGRR